MTLSFSAWQTRGALARGGAPFPVYGVWGDSFLQDRVVASLVETAIGEGERDFNLDSLDGEGAKVTDILAAISNLPFLSERRVVLVKRAEKVEGLGRASDGDDEEATSKKKKKSQVGANAATQLAKGIAALPPTTVLILARTPKTFEVGDREKEHAQCLNITLDKIIADAGALINCVIAPKNQSIVAQVLDNEAKERDIKLVRGATTHLVNRCGTDIAQLLGELEKCALRAGLSAPVTPAIIDEMTRPALNDTIYNLTDAIGARKGGEALSILHELLERGEAPEKLMASIVLNLRELMQARALLDEGLPMDASVESRMTPQLRSQFPQNGLIALLSNGQGWRANRAVNSARRFSQAQLRRALELCLEADLAMKGIEGDGGFDSKTNSAATMEILIARLCA
jgi:DNA polymerase-3 subunit delta